MITKKSNYLISFLLVALLALTATGAFAQLYDPNPDEDGVFYPYWNRGLPATATYFWNNWGNFDGVNPEVDADQVIGNVNGTATVTIGDGGAGFIEGGEWTEAAFGSATNFWDVGPGGLITLELDDPNAGTQGMDIWVQVKYHVGFTGTPTINVRSVSGDGVSESTPRLIDNGWYYRDLVESTGGWGETETGWLVYQALFRLDPGQTLAGIDIVTGGDGAIIDSIVVDTKILPERTAVLLAIFGSGALFLLMKLKKTRLAVNI